MTRSVEIPDALIEHVARRHWEHGQGGRWERPADAPDAPFPAYASEQDKAQYRAYARQLLKGAPALPYLAPAVPQPALTLHESWHEAHPGYPCEYDTCPKGQVLDLPPAAPAGDGGLREALAMKVGAWKYERGDLYWASQELGDLLAAHPAAPAVPQPVDREALWDAITKVRDASPRVPNDADSWDIVDAVLAVLAGEQEQARG